MNRPRPRSGIARTNETFDPVAANSERAEKLRLNGLRRRARLRGLELRHSSYGYALIDATGQRVDGRNDLKLDEVEAQLEISRS